MGDEEHCSFCNSTTGKHTQLVCGDNLCGQCISVFSVSGEGKFECPVCGAAILHEKADITHIVEENLSPEAQSCSFNVPPLLSASCAKNDDYSSARRDNVYMSMRNGWTSEPTTPIRVPTLPPRKPVIPTIRSSTGISPNPNEDQSLTGQVPNLLPSDTYFIQGMEDETAGVQIEGPVLPPRMKVPPPVVSRSYSQREQDEVPELPSLVSSGAKETPEEYSVSQKVRRSNTDSHVDYGDRRNVVNLSPKSPTDKSITSHLVEEIGEKYNSVDKLANECKNYIGKITKVSLGIEDAINESYEASTQNVDAIEKKRLKEVRVVSSKEDGDAEIVHNVHQTLINVTKEANDICEGTKSNRYTIEKGLLISQQLKALLGKEFLNENNEKVVFMENYLNYSVGSLSKRTQKIVGIVGLSDKFALMVADHRETLGVCIGLWSKIANKCVKWEVAFQPKDSKSLVVVSPNLGSDNSDASIMVTAIGETLYIKHCSRLFSDEAGSESEKIIRLKLGFNISSLACVEGKPNCVAFSCSKSDGSVYVYDCQTKHLTRKLSLSKDISFHVAFAAMFDSVLQFGILFREGSSTESLSIIDENGKIRQTLSEISIETSKVFPYIVCLDNSSGQLEIGVLFWNKLAACQFSMGKFDFKNMKPASKTAQLLVTQGQIPVNMTSLPGTSSYLLGYINGEALILTP